MYHTRNDMKEKIRFGICELLQKRLADALDLTSQAKQAHWNVKGANFIALHELFDKVYKSFEEYSDLMAERIAQLGGTIEGTVRMAAARTTLPEYPKNIIHERDHVASIAHVLASFGESIRRAIKTADESEDSNTADILTEISRGADKYLWLIEAHNQESQSLSKPKTELKMHV